MSKPALNLQFNGASHAVKIYRDGQMVVHTTNMSESASSLVVSISGGTHELRTLAELKVSALLGPCTVAVKGGPTKTLKTRGSMTIATGSTFTLKAASAVLQVIPSQGPGLGGPRNDDDMP